jgi:urease beta subunit
MKPGEIITCKAKDFIHANEHLETILVKVSNVGDRPIQVGSHMHLSV